MEKSWERFYVDHIDICRRVVVMNVGKEVVLMLRGRWYYFLLHMSVHELVNELTDRLLENPRTTRHLDALDQQAE